MAKRFLLRQRNKTSDSLSCMLAESIRVSGEKSKKIQQLEDEIFKKEQEIALLRRQLLQNQNASRFLTDRLSLYRVKLEENLLQSAEVSAVMEFEEIEKRFRRPLSQRFWMPCIFRRLLRPVTQMKVLP